MVIFDCRFVSSCCHGETLRLMWGPNGLRQSCARKSRRRWACDVRQSWHSQKKQHVIDSSIVEAPLLSHGEFGNCNKGHPNCKVIPHFHVSAQRLREGKCFHPFCKVERELIKCNLMLIIRTLWGQCFMTKTIWLSNGECECLDVRVNYIR